MTDDDDADYGQEEPDCFDCLDSGWRRPARTFTRDRRSRAACPECHPSPRQERRRPLRMQHLYRRWEARWLPNGPVDNGAPF